MPVPVIILRHGQSQWNVENRFTGWVDVPLTSRGEEEARQAGALIRSKGLKVDLAFTSFLKRAANTCKLVLESLDQTGIPIHADWRLNERHYGALSGLNKSETAAKYGEAQVHLWRRSFSVRPNPMTPDHPHFTAIDPKYLQAGLSESDIPLTECLADTVVRVEAFWNEQLLPCLRSGKKPLIAAHGNSLRALLKLLAGLSEDEVLELNIPTAQPMVLEFDDQFKLQSRQYLADPAVIEAALAEIAQQGKAQPVALG
ncbi:MAG: 2,3-diphosphoglycerate-dependent phosphoglycerate mutase [Burkholderiaceae bacterium]